MVKSLKESNEIEPFSFEQNEKTVYLGDLDLQTSESELSNFFSSINLPTVKVVKQSHSSFAHVTFDNPAVAKYLLEKTILVMNEKIIRVMPYNQPNNFDPNANLIIKNLESYLSESHIIDKFRLYGDILSCKLVRDSKGDSKCYAYLQFKHKSSAMACIDNLNNTYWDVKFDPDFHYQKYKEKMFYLKQNNNSLTPPHFAHLNSLDFNESNKKTMYGKKIYVGIFKKKDEYSKIKQEKEGKPSNLYVKNFGPNFGDRDLFNLFKSYGSIKSAKVRRQKCQLNDGIVEKPLGCGFVDFENPEEAEEARLGLNGYVISTGRSISVAYADCKSRRLRKKLEETHDDSKENKKPIYGLGTINSSFESIHLDDEFLFNEENRNRSISTSSESSFDSILLDWSERWNRQLCPEYKLF